jgi:hypothetical protein
MSPFSVLESLPQLPQEHLEAVLAAIKNWRVAMCSNASNDIQIGPNTKEVRNKYLTEGHLNRYDATWKDLRWIDLLGARMDKADLSGSKLESVANPFSRTHDNHFTATYMHKIDLRHANLIAAAITRSNLKDSLIQSALLIDANLANSDLSGAILARADMRWASLSGANLLGASFEGADMKGVVFEPQDKMLPNLEGMARAQNIDLMVYRNSPAGLTQLRDAFEAAGFHEQSKMITYAIRESTQAKELGSGKERALSVVIGFIKLIAFDLTSRYGLSPFRPILILIGLIVPFSLVYFTVLSRPAKKFGATNKSAIWVNWEEGAVNRDPH